MKYIKVLVTRKSFCYCSLDDCNCRSNTCHYISVWNLSRQSIAHTTGNKTGQLD